MTPKHPPMTAGQVELLTQAVATAQERDHLRSMVIHRETDCQDPHCWLRWSVWHAAAIRDAARLQSMGTRLVLAERALRLLIKGQPAEAAIAAWQTANHQEKHTNA